MTQEPMKEDEVVIVPSDQTRHARFEVTKEDLIGIVPIPRTKEGFPIYVVSPSEYQYYLTSDWLKKDQMIISEQTPIEDKGSTS